jgi:cysteinyl-tRNA synthetase
VRLSLGDKSYTAPLEVKEDPRIHTSESDLQKQFDLALQIRDCITQADDAVNEIRDVHSQLASLKKRIANDSKSAEIVSAADNLSKEMTAVEEGIVQTKSKSGEDPLNYPVQLADQLMELSGTVESADTAPTQASYAVFEGLHTALDAQIAKWNKLRDKELPAFNEKIRQADIPTIAVTSKKPAEGE